MFNVGVYLIHQSSDLPHQGQGLSTSAKIAIGIFVPILVLAAIALGVWCVLCRRKGGQCHSKQEDPGTATMELMGAREESPKRPPPKKGGFQWI